MSDAVVTVVTRNYLHAALALAASVRSQHAGLPIYVLFADRPPAPVEPPAAHTFFLFADELGIPHWRRFAFQYTPFELCCALKPHALSALLARGHERVVYLDSDIQVYAGLDPIFAALEHANLILTPHLIAPLPADGRQPDDLVFRRSGAFNAGFLALRHGDVAREFLRWWSARCERSCIRDPQGGSFVDQCWLDLAPGLFAGVRVARDPGWNVGHWRLAGSRIEATRAGALLVDGEPLRFFHFSGVAAGERPGLGPHQDRFTLAEIPVLEPLIRGYLAALEACDRKRSEPWGCAFDTLSDGTPIAPLWREAVRMEHPALAGITDPFDVARTPDLVSRLQQAARVSHETRVGWQLAHAERERSAAAQASPLRSIARRALRRLRGATRAERPHSRPRDPLASLDLDGSLASRVRAVQAYTMTSPERVVALCDAVAYLEQHAIPGAIVECGVWRGGSMMAAALTLRALGAGDRDLYLFDTFEGMPPPTRVDLDASGSSAASLLEQQPKRAPRSVWCVADLDDVRANLVSTGYPPEKLHFVVGRVEETLPAAAPERIALLRLDTDWYASTRHELEQLFPRLVPGGVLLLDDYGHWQGVRRAVDEYLAAQRIPLLLQRIDYTGRIAVLPRG